MNPMTSITNPTSIYWDDSNSSSTVESTYNPKYDECPRECQIPIGVFLVLATIFIIWIIRKSA